MKILYDGLPFQSESRDRGIGRFAANLLAGLKRVRPDWNLQLVMHAGLPAIPAAVAEEIPIVIFEPPMPITAQSRPAVERYYGDWLAARNADWVVLPSVFEKDGAVPIFSNIRPRTAAVLHDLIPLLFMEWYLTHWNDLSYYSQRFRQFAATDLLLSNSIASAADALRLIAPSPWVVPILGASDPYFEPLKSEEVEAAVQAVRTKHRLHKPFILYVGGNDFRKNLYGAIDGFAALPAALSSTHELVIVCSMPDHRKQEIAAYAESRGVGGSVRTTGFIPDEDLLALYHACRIFFFPSQYEGLGLPILEALKCGAAVVAADNSSLPEFAGAVSWYCNADQPATMATALAAALAEPRELRESERKRFALQFTWDDCALRAAEALESERATVAPPRMRRVAWVSPAPPAARPMANVSAEIAAALAGRIDLEWVVESNHDAASGLPSGTPVLTLDELSARHDAAPFDVFIYHFGESSDHDCILNLIQKHPGLVVLHEARAACSPTRFTGDTMTIRALESATGVIVHSIEVWQQVRRVTETPVIMIPLAAPQLCLNGKASVYDVVAERYTAMIEDAAARSEAQDRPWIDSASNALAAIGEAMPKGLPKQWATLRSRVLHSRPTAARTSIEPCKTNFYNFTQGQILLPFNQKVKPMISYAQNCEDVLLHRAFPEGPGFYIDVGAADPVELSVTKWFYDRGWTGINLEPQLSYFRPFNAARPRDINLNAGLSDVSGETILYDAHGYPGWATMEKSVADDFRRRGIPVTERRVPIFTLAEICERHVRGPINFLKIDVEGYEARVLRGADFKRWRPLVLVIEATEVGSPMTNFESWEHIVLAANYRFGMFDGLNRYYVRAENSELLAAFQVPANIFDGYTPHELVLAREELAKLRAEAAELRQGRRKSA